MSTVRHDVVEGRATQSPRKHKGWRWVIWITLIAFVVLLVVGEVMLKRAEPILKGRVIETLSTRFNSHVELDDLQVSLIKGLAVSGKGLRIYAPDDVVAAGAKDPLIAVQQFEFHAGSDRFVPEADARRGSARAGPGNQHPAQIHAATERGEVPASWQDQDRCGRDRVRRFSAGDWHRQAEQGSQGI